MVGRRTVRTARLRSARLAVAHPFDPITSHPTLAADNRPSARHGLHSVETERGSFGRLLPMCRYELLETISWLVRRMAGHSSPSPGTFLQKGRAMRRAQRAMWLLALSKPRSRLVPLPDPIERVSDPCQRHSQDRHHDEYRPQSEGEPAASKGTHWISTAWPRDRSTVIMRLGKL